MRLRLRCPSLLAGPILAVLWFCPGVQGEQSDTRPGTIVLAPVGEAEAAPHGQGNLYAPDVLFDGKRFRMWYGAQGRDGHDQIYWAESPDGREWTRRGMAISRGKANHVNDPSVVKVGETYFLFYTYTPRDVLDEIAVATSRDGVTWELQGTVLRAGKPEEWDGLSVGRPAVLFAGGKFLMWYDGRKDFPPGSPIKNVPVSNHSSRAVGLAISTDGKNFERVQGTPVFGEDAGAVHVAQFGEQYVMTYESREGTRFTVSRDGKQWAKGRLLLPKSRGAEEAFGHVTPFLWLSGDQARGMLFYGASSAETWDHNRIGMFPFTREELARRIKSP